MCSIARASARKGLARKRLGKHYEELRMICGPFGRRSLHQRALLRPNL